MPNSTPNVPASLFGIVLGLAGLGNSWRIAHRIWDLPEIVGEVLMLAAVIVWAILLCLYVLKWLYARPQALSELEHPIQCCFIGLIGVATMLIAGSALPYSHLAAKILYGAGALFTAGFAVWRTGGLWQGGRDPGMTTAVLYLPTGAGSFVASAGASALGHPNWGMLIFGAGLFSSLAIESVLVHRLYTTALPPPLRPTLGIQLAPPVVGALAYLGATSGPPDMFVHAMVGYGILQGLILLRMLPWIMQAPFAASYWAFTFGATALAAAPMRLIERGDTGVITMIAPVLFVGANITVVLIALGTLKLLAAGTLLGQPAPKPQ